MNFRDCIAARDPYCIWNNQTGVCEKSNLSGQNDLMGDVPEWLVTMIELLKYLWVLNKRKDHNGMLG